jgi:hypothetical protein
MIKMKTNVTPGETPPKISVMQIDQDLKDGINKTEMTVKYGIKPWEVDEMFKHPLLKGRRPARKRALSFEFVDDTTDLNQIAADTRSKEFNHTLTDAQEALDPNQTSIPVPDESDSTESNSHRHFVDEEFQKNSIDLDTPPSFDDTMSVVEEQEWEAGNIEEEEELKMDEDTFEL